MTEAAELAHACGVLERYHLGHTADPVTRFRGKTDPLSADIYIVSAPHWKRAIAACVKPVMDEQDLKALEAKA